MKKKYLLIFLFAFIQLNCDNINKPKKKILIGFSQCTAADDWRKSMNEEIFRESAFYADYEIDFLYRDANNNTFLQIEQIKVQITGNSHQFIVLISCLNARSHSGSQQAGN